MDGVRLKKLLSSVESRELDDVQDRQITGVYYDSRQVKPGGLFVAVPGMTLNGQDYIDDAIKHGAVAIVAEKPAVVPTDISMVTAQNPRKVLASLAASFYGDPSQDLVVIGVTGTNGKTTTAYLVEAIFRAAGHNVGVIGTIDYRYNGQSFENPVTTPESLDLMRMLREMVDGGVTHVVLEVSSHALDLERVSSCAFDVGVFTNLSQDHLDYHKDMETYWQCKKRLCTQCLQNGSKQRQAVAVVNRDDPRGASLAAEVAVPCLSFGLSEACHIRGEGMDITIEGIRGTVHTPAGSFDVRSTLVGYHNVYNILTAVGVASAVGVDIPAMKKGIASLHGVPGRLEPVRGAGDVSVFVDYAHTPDALENVLSALKSLTPGRLITVFGCGGDRDRKKRPLMGAVAARLSDLTVVTSDNPRSEEPEKIIEDIEAGMRSVARRYEPEAFQNAGDTGYAVEPNRKEAIRLGLMVARSEDTVLIAGKGHETYQIIGDRTIAFDDRLEAEKVLRQMAQSGSGGR